MPGLRVGDVEEAALGGNEEAQFEVDNEQVANIWSIAGQDPHDDYSRAYYLNANFSENLNLMGQPAWVQTGMQLERLAPVPDNDYLFYMHATESVF